MHTHTKRTGHLIPAPVNSLLSCTLNLALMSLAVDRPKDRVLDSVSKGNLASGERPDLVKDWLVHRWHSQAAQDNFSVKYKAFLTENITAASCFLHPVQKYHSQFAAQMLLINLRTLLQMMRDEASDQLADWALSAVEGTQITDICVTSFTCKYEF